MNAELADTMEACFINITKRGMVMIITKHGVKQQRGG
jgi:hypothetical protein